MTDHAPEYIIEVVLFNFYATVKRESFSEEKTPPLTTQFTKIYKTAEERESQKKYIRRRSAKELGIPEEQLPPYKEENYKTLGDIVAEIKNF
ncbi:MAG: hypothetical protein Q7S74_00755 [Nanoarchaeota archaeon]|nr:hypothetical protein [Nanoarchaeota archaeon]